jgi:DNA repair exonuclease SbcCD nuclease subunit
MSKLALVTDTHFGARADSLLFHDYFNKFYNGLFFPTIDKLKIKTVVHLGDLVDRRKFINFNILSKMRKDFINPLRDRNIKMHIVPGNHDTFFKNTNEVNALNELFSDTEHIKIHNEPEEVTIGGRLMLMLPWINMENHERSMERIKRAKAQVCMGHLELSGFYVARGLKNETGMDKKLFRKFKHVITGHYHHKSDDGKIFYLGSPYEFTFIDLNDPKGFHIYDTETLELTFVQNPHRMFYRLYYDDREKSLDDLISKRKLEKLTGTYVKIIVTNKTNPFLFDQFIEKIYQIQPADVSVIENLEYHSNDVTELNMAEDTLTILGKYVDGMELDVDKVRIKEKLKELYIEAANMDVDKE